MEKNTMRPVRSGKNMRMSYSRQKEVLEIPNLIEIQKKSYYWFLDEGLKEAFEDISPIKFSPITGILRWVGHKLTGELREQIAALRADVDAQQKDSIRTTVLEFSNSLIYRNRHTKEEFDHILELDSKYHQLLKAGEKNSVYDSAIAFVRRVEAKCRDEGGYLQIPKCDKEGE